MFYVKNDGDISDDKGVVLDTKKIFVVTSGFLDDIRIEYVVDETKLAKLKYIIDSERMSVHELNLNDLKCVRATVITVDLKVEGKFIVPSHSNLISLDRTAFVKNGAPEFKGPVLMDRYTPNPYYRLFVDSENENEITIASEKLRDIICQAFDIVIDEDQTHVETFGDYVHAIGIIDNFIQRSWK